MSSDSISLVKTKKEKIAIKTWLKLVPLSILPNVTSYLLLFNNIKRKQNRNKRIGYESHPNCSYDSPYYDNFQIF